MDLLGLADLPVGIRRRGEWVLHSHTHGAMRFFTLVGIAGDDDLDASDIDPDTSAAEVRQVEKTATNPANGPSRDRRSSASSLDIYAEAETARTNLLTEIAAFPTVEQSQVRAADFLKAKNRLPPEEAKQIEAAVSTRMAAFEMVQSQSDSAGMDPIEGDRADKTIIAPNVVRPKRRSRRVQNAVPASSLDLESKGAANSPTIETSEVSKIDKSVLTLGEPRRKRDKQHLRFVASQPCLICGRAPSDAHHLRFAQPRAMGRKSSDEFVVPLCRTHHRQNHQTGREETWWASVSMIRLRSPRSFGVLVMEVPRNRLSLAVIYLGREHIKHGARLSFHGACGASSGIWT